MFLKGLKKRRHLDNVLVGDGRLWINFSHDGGGENVII
jgi:hypothetical protein